MRKSCLVQFILLAVVIVVLSLAVRQAIVRGTQARPAATPVELTPTPEDAALGAAQGAVAQEAAAADALAPAPVPAADAAAAALTLLAAGR